MGGCLRYTTTITHPIHPPSPAGYDDIKINTVSGAAGSKNKEIRTTSNEHGRGYRGEWCPA